MLNRDFTKSNKEYFAKNKIILISIAVFLILGITILSIFGLNGNFEMSGCYEFNIQITEEQTKNFSDHQREISQIVNAHDAKFDCLSIYGKGDGTQYVVRYMNDVNGEKQLEINKLIVEKLDVEIDDISEHIYVQPVVKKSDYVYTIATILILLTIATIFAYFRYNGASALSLLLSCVIGTLEFVSISAILRLSVGMSYFAMLAILNMLIIYFAIDTFEHTRKSGWLASRDFSSAMTTALKASRFRTIVISFAVMLIGVLFILLGTTTIKFAILNIMFMIIIALATIWYVMPFFWNVFITRTRIKEYKIKSGKTENEK